MTQNIELNMIPNGIPAIIYASQLDTSRVFKFTLYEGTEKFNIASGAEVSINGRKDDDTIFIYTKDDDVLSWEDNVVTVKTTMQMTAVSGETLCQLRVDDGAGTNLGSVEFTLEVSEMPGADEEGVSKSELPSIIAQAKEQEKNAAKSAADAKDYAERAEVYKNNAYEAAARSAASAEAAKGSEDSVAANAQAAQEAATDARAAVDEAIAWSSHPPYIGENGNWWIYNTTTKAFEDSGIDASITVQIADITMLNYGETPRVTNTGTNTDPVFHLFIPRGARITKVEKTATSGLVDTYTMTMQDGATATFTVTNGKSAYQYAIEGGFDGTETEFNSALGNFREWKESAETAATTATGAAGRASQSAADAKNEADRAELYADFVTPHFIIENNRLYIKEDAELEFITANNRLYIKAA